MVVKYCVGLLLVVTTTEMMIGVPAVVIKDIARAEEGVVVVVILTEVNAREANSKVGQEEKILVLMNWTLSRYFAPIS